MTRAMTSAVAGVMTRTVAGIVANIEIGYATQIVQSHPLLN
ncbi:MAG: hypothetical protein BWY82_03033 [Verrucomicrobia bacterium ADurb.Bin474]|nr:MAG: hypothetical protein BWY82_03033 [Verrucomicrobia bacterium ADurb.Bin474]